MKSHHHCLDPEDMTPEERMDALADVLAEGFLYLAERELLNLDDEPILTSDAANQKLVGRGLLSGGKEGTPSKDGCQSKGEAAQVEP